MNNCQECSLEMCLNSGTEGIGCKSFELRELTKFEKSIIRHGLICGLILGFLFCLSITFPFWR